MMDSRQDGGQKLRGLSPAELARQQMEGGGKTYPPPTPYLPPNAEDGSMDKTPGAGCLGFALVWIGSGVLLALICLGASVWKSLSSGGSGGAAMEEAESGIPCIAIGVALGIVVCALCYWGLDAIFRDAGKR
jgi:hypothetical protein